MNERQKFKDRTTALGVTPLDTGLAHIKITSEEWGELEQATDTGLILAYLCPECPNTHLLFLDSQTYINIKLTIEQAEALAAQLLSPNTLTKKP
jgi:hypothetical protein